MVKDYNKIININYSGEIFYPAKLMPLEALRLSIFI